MGLAYVVHGGGGRRKPNVQVLYGFMSNIRWAGHMQRLGKNTDGNVVTGWSRKEVRGWLLKVPQHGKVFVCHVHAHQKAIGGGVFPN